MAMTAETSCRVCDLVTPRRNCYFHGQLLDVQQFELETTYHSAKRWLLNRHVIGYGVVCGLGVAPAPGGKGVVVAPGLAIDRMGREILVPETTRPLAVPPELFGGEAAYPAHDEGYSGEGYGEEERGEPETYGRGKEPRRDPYRAQAYGDEPPEHGKEPPEEEAGYRQDPADRPPGHREEGYGEKPRGKGYGPGHGEGYGGGYGEEGEEEHVHLVLCYHECKAEPTPVLAGECCDPEPCRPAVIQERYRLELRPGCAAGAGGELVIPDVIEGGRLDYPALVEWVSGDCAPCPDDPCIPLANVRLRGGGRCHAEDIDITVRPIVYGNDLLFQLLLSLLTESPRQRRGK